MRILRLGQSLCSSNGSLGSSDFEFSVNTATVGSTTSTQFQLPLVSSGAISIDVDWGDGTTDTITTYNQAETLHTYSVSGIYDIKISNEVRGWQFNDGGDKAKITNVSNCGELNITENSAFYGCSNMTWTAVDTPTISNTSLTQTFRDCTLFNGNINHWNVSSVINISHMFNGCTNFNQPLNNWNTGSFRSMGYMFKECTNFNQPLNNWNTGLANSIYSTLHSATSFDQDLSSWDIRNITNANYFMRYAGISTANYNALLVGWEAQVPQLGVTTDFGSSTYDAAPNAAGVAHDSLTAAAPTGFGWTITDGGTA
tara:strand:- start:446 stop:1384 length:939 start_codon:yes stop_codon:yes gene_type:complete